MAKFEAINEKAKNYNKVLAQPWNVLGYRLRQHNLAKHLPASANILDIGGGNAQEAKDLAALGHKVVVLEPSTEMFAQAVANTKGLAQISLYQTSLENARPYLAEASFDLVLCHNVLQYLSNKQHALAEMAVYLKPEGLLSLVALNKYSEPFRLATQQQNLARAKAALNASSYVTEALGVAVDLLSADEVKLLAENAGLQLFAQYGIRCMNDYILDSPDKTLEAIFDLEQGLSDLYPYYLLARFFHLILKKV